MQAILTYLSPIDSAQVLRMIAAATGIINFAATMAFLALLRRRR